MTLVILASSWVTGVYLSTLVRFPWQTALLFLAASGLLGLLLRGRGTTLVPAVAVALLALGAFRGDWPHEPRELPPIQAYNGWMGLQMEGLIATDPQPSGSGWRFVLDIERVKPSDGWVPSHGEAQVFAVPSPELTSARGDRPFRYGDRVSLTGDLQAPPVFQDFDYREYLASQGVFSTVVRPSVVLLGEGEGNPMNRGLSDARHRLALGLSRALPEPQSALAQALLLGRRSAMTPELTQAFRDTGTSHLLAISGLHIGVLLGLSLALSRWLLGVRRAYYLLIPLVAIWGYAALSGMSPSVERAAVMGSIYLLGMGLGRQQSVMPALAAAAAIMVGLQPELLSSVSFQLSFTAMAGLALLAPPLERRLHHAIARDDNARQWSRTVSYAVAATVAATLATLPLVAFYFHQLSLVGLPATLLALPALPAVLLTSLATALLSLVNPVAAQVSGWAAWLTLSYVKFVVEVFHALPGNAITIGRIGPALVLAYYGVGLALLFGRSRLRGWFSQGDSTLNESSVGVQHSARPALGRRSFWAMSALALAAAASMFALGLARPDGRLHVTFLDVGQGDATFIVTPRGQQILIDGGPDPRRLLNLLGSRMPFWDHSLDLVVLTHAHEDHLAGLVEVLRRYDVDMVLERQVDYGSPEYAMWRAVVEKEDATVLQAFSGQRIELETGLALDVLYPPDRLLEGTSSDVNNASVVARLVYGDTSFLFPGDLEQPGESYLLHRAQVPESTVLKVGHQGSRTSTSTAFFDAVSPQLAVIFAGKDNRFGHPHQETLDTLRASLPDDRVLVTAIAGTVELTSDGSRLWMSQER